MNARAADRHSSTAICSPITRLSPVPIASTCFAESNASFKMLLFVGQNQTFTSIKPSPLPPVHLTHTVAAGSCAAAQALLKAPIFALNNRFAVVAIIDFNI